MRPGRPIRLRSCEAHSLLPRDVAEALAALQIIQHRLHKCECDKSAVFSARGRKSGAFPGSNRHGYAQAEQPI